MKPGDSGGPAELSGLPVAGRRMGVTSPHPQRLTGGRTLNVTHSRPAFDIFIYMPVYISICSCLCRGRQGETSDSRASEKLSFLIVGGKC